MSEADEDYYQPWLKDPAAPPLKRRVDGATVGEPGTAPLARPATPPLGVDLEHYSIADADSMPPSAIVRHGAASAASTGKAVWQSVRSGAARFADWTIAIGSRADVPARVGALQIPRRTATAAQLTGAALGYAGRQTGQQIGRAAQMVKTATRTGWKKLRVMDHSADIADASKARLAELGEAARLSMGRAARSGKAASQDALNRMRGPDPSPPPVSGLDRLIERDAGMAARDIDAEPPALPLFSAARSADTDDHVPRGIVPQTPAQTVPPVALPPGAETKARSDGPRRATAPRDGATSGGPHWPALPHWPASLPRWWPWGAALLMVAALAFWLGGRMGGGTDRATMETVVRETILNNPEIVPEALERHQANQIATAIASVRPALEKPFSGAWIGNPKGDVTVVIFTDYGCVFCRASVPDVDRLVREDKGVKIVFRELPIIAPQSRDAAIAALVAARQGKYSAFHHAMFAAPALDAAAILAASTRAGVIVDGRADAGGDTRQYEREIDNNLALAQQLRLNATPAWVIGDKLIEGAAGFDGLREAVAAARDKR